MKHLIFLLAFTISTFAIAQDTIHVTTVYKAGQKNEDYYRNPAGDKHGKYVRFTKYGNKYVEGQYTNGFPSGIWNYYSADTAGILVQTLDFDKHKETFCDSMRVQGLICGPRFFGGNMLQQEYIQMRIKSDFTETERQRLKGTSVLAVFDVDPLTYKTIGINVDDAALTEDLKNKIIKIVSEMPAWLPPVCKDKNLVWRMSVVFVFQ